MSESKKPKSTVNRIVTKPVRLPFNWAVPRHAIKGFKEFKFKSARYPICPNCSLNRFTKQEYENESEVSWICPSCDFEVRTKNGELKDIQNWCHENAKEVFENSEYHQKRFEEYEQNSEDGFIALNIKRNMMACYSFLGVAVFMLLMFLYASWQVNIMFMINSLLFTLGFMFFGLVFNYRAWQAFSGNLYSENAKEQFHWWLRTHTWFKQPMDIGTPP